MIDDDSSRSKSMAPPPRVLSLLSASTEIVHRLGCAHLLVGRSHGCDDPPLATTLPVATAPRVDPNASSKEIDDAVRAQAVAGGPIYSIHSDFVRDVKPDIIITQEQCRICAVTPEDVAEACAMLPSTKLVTIKPTTLEDVLGDVLTIAEAIGVPERGARLVAMLRARLAALTALIPATAPSPPKVAHVEWLQPLMGSGYWIAECMTAAGCQMVHGDAGGHSCTLESPSLLADADVILLAPCGFSVERTHAELQAIGLLRSPEWLALPAVRRGAVAIADGNLYFNRSSCGILETAEIAAEVAHPELVGLLGHHGKRWVHLSELEAFCARTGAPPVCKPVALAAARETTAPATAPPPRKLARRTTGCTAIEHVSAQVGALQAGDFTAAFEANSAANCARLGDAAKFEAIVRGSSSFCTLTVAADISYNCEDDDGAPTSTEQPGVAVVVTVMTSSAQFAFDVSRDDDGCWQTDGVRIQC